MIDLTEPTRKIWGVERIRSLEKERSTERDSPRTSSEVARYVSRSVEVVGLQVERRVASSGGLMKAVCTLVLLF